MITGNWDLDYFEADEMLESATFSLRFEIWKITTFGFFWSNITCLIVSINFLDYFATIQRRLVDDDLGMKTEWGCRRHIRHSNLDRELDNCKYSEASWTELGRFFIWEGKNRVLTKLTLFSASLMDLEQSSYTQYFSSFCFLED